jgi:hypothetical protein
MTRKQLRTLLLRLVEYISWPIEDDDPKLAEDLRKAIEQIKQDEMNEKNEYQLALPLKGKR